MKSCQIRYAGESRDGGEFDGGLIVEKFKEIIALSGFEEDDEKARALQASDGPSGGEAFQAFVFEHMIENDGQPFFRLTEKEVSVIEKHFGQNGGMRSVFISHLKGSFGFRGSDNLKDILFDNPVNPAIILFLIAADHPPQDYENEKKGRKRKQKEKAGGGDDKSTAHD
jgi:hypothetical protein